MAELNAFFAALGFGWLVGECELKVTDRQVRRRMQQEQHDVREATCPHRLRVHAENSRPSCRHLQQACVL